MTIMQFLASIWARFKPCLHEWHDEGTVVDTWNGKPIGKKMVQRCQLCRKYRRLKMW